MNFGPLKNFLDNCLSTLAIPGSDTVIYRGYDEIFRYQSGFDNIRERTKVRPDALYNMYSVTKVSTAICAMQLLERGELRVADPLHIYFPEFKHINVKYRLPNGEIELREAQNPILIKHLFSMTAGLNYNLDTPSIRQLRIDTDGRCPTLDTIRALASEPLEFEPGTEYNYSLCHDVLGALIELISGMKLSEYMKRNLFEPLELTDTGFSVPQSKLSRMASQYNYDAKSKSAIEISKTECRYKLGSDYESGGAGIISTVDDQIKIAVALTHLGKGKSGARILSPYSVELMRKNLLTTNQLNTFRRSAHLDGYGYAYGVRTNISPELAGNLMLPGEFGWDGAKLSYLSASPESKISIFHAEHMGAHHATVIPRLRNVIYSCLHD